MIIDTIASVRANEEAAKDLNRELGVATDLTNKYYNKAEEYQQPYLQQGQRYYKTLGNMIDSGQFNMPTEEFQSKEFNFQVDPSYQFRLNEGLNAIQGSAAARGSALSGATLKALTKYGQNLASEEYQNAYNRYNTNRNFDYNNFTDSYNRRQTNLNNQYNMYNNMANTGVNAANNLGTLAVNRGTTLADLAMQRGNVLAQQHIANANAVGNAVNQGWQLAGLGTKLALGGA